MLLAFYTELADKMKQIHEDEVADWVDEDEVSNYHTFTVPYGVKFHAKKIEKLCYTKDLCKYTCLVTQDGQEA